MKAYDYAYVETVNRWQDSSKPAGLKLQDRTEERRLFDTIQQAEDYARSLNRALFSLVFVGIQGWQKYHG